MDGRAWFDLLLDPGWELRFEDVLGDDPLGFPGYADAFRTARANTGESESLLVAEGTLDGHPVVVTSSVFGFMGGSMGWAHGERVCRAFELATERGVPLIACTASGGARMQEGMVALAQMPATLQARAVHRAAGLPMIAVLRHPTTGGVVASYANQADRRIGLAGATIGFAGPRVAEAFTGEPLPAGSHTAENAHAHGLIDEVAGPDTVRARILEALAAAPALRSEAPIRPRTRWRLAPTPERPLPLGLIEDRAPARPLPPEDAWGAVTSARDATQRKARRAALAEIGATGSVGRTSIAGREVVLIDLAEARTPDVADFQAVQGAIRDATATGRPLVVLVDMAGANPSVSSEAAGIARTISDTMSLAATTPAWTIALVAGEGGSGGALALCAGADRLAICEGAFFSVIAPEGAAAILRRDDVAGVARDLRCGPRTLVALGLADEIVADVDAAEWVAEQVRGAP